MGLTQHRHWHSSVLMCSGTVKLWNLCWNPLAMKSNGVVKPFLQNSLPVLWNHDPTNDRRKVGYPEKALTTSSWHYHMFLPPNPTHNKHLHSSVDNRHHVVKAHTIPATQLHLTYLYIGLTSLFTMLMIWTHPGLLIRQFVLENSFYSPCTVSVYFPTAVDIFCSCT